MILLRFCYDHATILLRFCYDYNMNLLRLCDDSATNLTLQGGNVSHLGGLGLAQYCFYSDMILIPFSCESYYDSGAILIRISYDSVTICTNKAATCHT